MLLEIMDNKASRAVTAHRPEHILQLPVPADIFGSNNTG